MIVNVTAGRLGSETFSATVNLGGQEVEKADLVRVLRAVNDRSVRPERSIIHALPIGYALDGQKGIKDPRGMVGEKLGVDVAVISAETLAMRNIELVLNRCHLQIEALVATPYASGLVVAGRRRGQARRLLHRLRRRDDDGRRVLRRAAGLHRRHRDRRPSPDARHRAARSR